MGRARFPVSVVGRVTLPILVFLSAIAFARLWRAKLGRESEILTKSSSAVTDEVAPGYSSIIKEPMCLTTVQAKLERGEYHDFDSFEVS